MKGLIPFLATNQRNSQTGRVCPTQPNAQQLVIKQRLIVTRKWYHWIICERNIILQLPGAVARGRRKSRRRRRGRNGIRHAACAITTETSQAAGCIKPAAFETSKIHRMSRHPGRPRVRECRHRLPAGIRHPPTPWPISSSPRQPPPSRQYRRL